MQKLGLWKSTVLQNLRYIQSTTDVKKLQISLNLSLARALHVYGDHTALLADTGVPPLILIQYTHLAQMHFRLTKTRSDTLPAILYTTFNQFWALSKLHPSTLDYHIRNSLHQLHINPVKELPYRIRVVNVPTVTHYGVATVSRIGKFTGLFCRIPSLS